MDRVRRSARNRAEKLPSRGDRLSALNSSRSAAERSSPENAVWADAADAARRRAVVQPAMRSMGLRTGVPLVILLTL